MQHLAASQHYVAMHHSVAQHIVATQHFYTVFSGKVEAAHPAIEGAAIDAKDAGSLGFIAAGLVQGVGNLVNRGQSRRRR